MLKFASTGHRGASIPAASGHEPACLTRTTNRDTGASREGQRRRACGAGAGFASRRSKARGEAPSAEAEGAAPSCITRRSDRVLARRPRQAGALPSGRLWASTRPRWPSCLQRNDDLSPPAMSPREGWLDAQAHWVTEGIVAWPRAGARPAGTPTHTSPSLRKPAKPVSDTSGAASRPPGARVPASAKRTTRPAPHTTLGDDQRPAVSATAGFVI